MYEAHQRSRYHNFRVSLFNLNASEQTRNFTLLPLFFSVSAILPQLFVLGLTIKRFISGLRAGWGRIPIVSRLVRDDIILVSVICEFQRKRRVNRSFRSLKFVVEGLKLNWFSIPFLITTTSNFYECVPSKCNFYLSLQWFGPYWE